MKLTKADKEAFVRAVLDDVPSHNFDEMAQLLVIGYFKKVLPKNVIAVLENKETRDYIDSNYVGMPGCLCDFYSRYRPVEWQWGAQFPEDVSVRLHELATFKKEQSAKFSSLRSEVTGMIAPISTLKAALAKLPEFAKYLPAEREVTGTVNLPVSNVVAELMNAGWPKEGGDAKETTA